MLLCLLVDKCFSFQVLHTLGFGGFGDVYAVKETHTGKAYALKTEENVSGKESRLKVTLFVYRPSLRANA